MNTPETRTSAVPPSSYALPYQFPNGPVWAAIRGDVVMNMVYMDRVPEGVQFNVFRQRSRADLAKNGVVWSGDIRGGRFWPRFETSDVRHTGQCNTAREVRE